MTTDVRPLRTILYARVSRADSAGDTTSVDEQLAALGAAVARAGGVVVATLTDRAISASGVARHRPSWVEVLRLVEAGDVDAVALWEVSRSSRRLAEWATFRDLCVRHEVVWITPDAVVDPASGRDRLSLGVKAVVAEEESAQTSDRIRRTVRERASAGRPHGRETYGYRRVYDPATGRLDGVTVVDAEAAVVRRLASGVLAGRGLRTMGRELDAEGVPCPADAIAARRGRPSSGHSWTGRVIRDLLRSRALVGVRVHTERARFDRGRVVAVAEAPAVWPAILTEDEHARLVAILNDPARSTRDSNSPEVRHWLSGVLRCGKCGDRMRWDRVRRTPDRVAEYYRCPRVGCRGATIDHTVEDIVEAVIVARLGRPDAVAALNPSDEPRAEAARVVLGGAEGRLDALAAAYAGGSIGLRAFAAAEAKLTEQIAAARVALAEVEAPPALPGWAEVPDAATAWADWDPAARNAVARALFTRIEVKPSGRTGRPAKGTRVVSPARLGFLRRGTDDVVWGVDDRPERAS